VATYSECVYVTTLEGILNIIITLEFRDPVDSSAANLQKSGKNSNFFGT
jgi:hypothetical protein